jgi:hypothetical protein
MKLLHTSDWRIGRALYGRKRYDEFEAFLDWIAALIEIENIDVLLLCPFIEVVKSQWRDPSRHQAGTAMKDSGVPWLGEVPGQRFSHPRESGNPGVTR